MRAAPVVRHQARLVRSGDRGLHRDSEARGRRRRCVLLEVRLAALTIIERRHRSSLCDNSYINSSSFRFHVGVSSRTFAIGCCCWKSSSPRSPLSSAATAAACSAENKFLIFCDQSCDPGVLLEVLLASLTVSQRRNRSGLCEQDEIVAVVVLLCNNVQS